MQVQTLPRTPSAALAPARPNPRVAARLSLVVPGLGQAYCGGFVTAPIFGGLAVFFVLSFLQAWDQWGRSWLFLGIAALVIALYAGNAVLSSRLAARRAARMERHGAIWRGFAWWWRAGNATDSACELALFVGFILACAGVAARWPLGHAVAEWLRYWPVFELLGGFSVGYYAGFIEELEARTAGPRKSTRSVVTGLLVFQAAAVAVLLLLFRLPPWPVLAACLVTLPGQIQTFVVLNGDRRKEAKLRAGSILIAFMLSFFTAFVLASFLERPGVTQRDLGVFASMAMGAIYTFIRTVLDAVVRNMKEDERPSG